MRRLLAKLFPSLREREPWKPCRIWNIPDHNQWGNSLGWSSWSALKIYGFLPNRYAFQKDDEVRDRMESGKTARFRVRNVEYCLDPRDMFFADLNFIGYVDEPDGGAR